MADFSTIRKRLEKHILSSGHTFREISLKIGRKDSYIQQYIKYGFPKRLNEVDRKKVCQLLNIDEKELIDDDLLKSGITDNSLLKLDEIGSSPKDFVLIDICNPNANTKEQIIGRLAVNYKEFFGWFNGNPDNTKIIRLNSDSMEPSFPTGCLIIYDSSVTEYAGEGLYVIKFDEQIMLRRIQRTSEDSYYLKSENPRYQDIRCAASEIEIYGRAINYLSSRAL